MCINIKPPEEGIDIAEKITEELSQLLTVKNSTDKAVGTSGSDSLEVDEDVYICPTLEGATEVVKKMFPSRMVVNNFGLVPTELCGFRLCQGQQLLVATITGYHPDKKRHGMMICVSDTSAFSETFFFSKYFYRALLE